jgi:hypothetical protein
MNKVHTRAAEGYGTQQQEKEPGGSREFNRLVHTQKLIKKCSKPVTKKKNPFEKT